LNLTAGCQRDPLTACLISLRIFFCPSGIQNKVITFARRGLTVFFELFQRVEPSKDVMRIVTVKRATFVFVGIAALCAALSAGCGSKQPSSGTALKPSDLGAKDFPKMGAAFSNAPEMKILQIHSPQDKANYLKSLATDSSFVAKDHVSFLEQQAKDPDPDVANAAKDLLDKAK
jgi:hypothetical protein